MSRLRYGVDSVNDAFDLLTDGYKIGFQHLLGTDTVHFDGAVFADRATAVTELTAVADLPAYKADKLTKNFTEAAFQHHRSNVIDPMTISWADSPNGQITFKRGVTNPLPRPHTKGFLFDPEVSAFHTLHGKIEAIFENFWNTVSFRNTDDSAYSRSNTFAFVPHGDTAESKDATVAIIKDLDVQIMQAMGYSAEVIERAVERSHFSYAAAGDPWHAVTNNADFQDMLGDGMFYFQGVKSEAMVGSAYPGDFVHHYMLPSPDRGSIGVSMTYTAPETLKITGPQGAITASVGKLQVDYCKWFALAQDRTDVQATLTATGTDTSQAADALCINIADSLEFTKSSMGFSQTVNWGRVNIGYAPTATSPRYAHSLLKSDFSTLPGYVATIPVELGSTRVMWNTYHDGNTALESCHLPTHLYVCVIAPSHFDSLALTYTAISANVRAKDIIYTLSGDTVAHIQSSGLRFKGYLVELASQNPDDSADILLEAAKLDGYEDALIIGAYHETPIALPTFAARDSEIGLKYTAAGKDIYVVELASGITFKTAQNRVDAMDPQNMFTTIFDDAIAHSDLVPVEVQQYNEPGNFFVSRKADDSFWVSSKSTDLEVAALTEYQALALVFSGVGIGETINSITTAEMQTFVDSVLGAPDTDDSLVMPFQPDTFGGGWLDLHPGTFMKGRQIRFDLLTGDALKRGSLIMKGVSKSDSLESTFRSMYSVLVLDTGFVV